MQFPDPLIRGELVKRYKRFLADVRLDLGEIVTAHCANTGTMDGVCAPGSEVWLSPARNPTRKLRYSWEMIRVGGVLVGINTTHPNAIVAEAIAADAIPALAGYEDIRREVRYGQNSRIDLLLSGDGRPDCYVEVKNVHLKRGEVAAFPDAVTVRGTKHLVEMSRLVEAGLDAVTVYLVQRADCTSFAIADDIDPTYAAALSAARAAGVRVICHACRLSPEAIELDRPLPLAL